MSELRSHGVDADPKLVDEGMAESDFADFVKASESLDDDAGGGIDCRVGRPERRHTAVDNVRCTCWLCKIRGEKSRFAACRARSVLDLGTLVTRSTNDAHTCAAGREAQRDGTSDPRSAAHHENMSKITIVHEESIARTARRRVEPGVSFSGRIVSPPMNTAVDARALSRLVQLDRPLLQLMELIAPWCARVEGCLHPGMYVVHRGTARIDVMGQSLRLDAGDFVLLPRGGGQHVIGDAFGTVPSPLEELALRDVRRSAQCRKLRGAKSSTLISGIPFQSPPIAWLPRVLGIRCCDSDRIARSLLSAYEHALEREEGEVVARIAEALWIHTIAERLPHVSRLDIDVLRAASMVLEDPTPSYTLHSLARTATLSRSRFSARFTSAFGEPPMRWVQRVRMDHAERLIRGGTLSIATIATLMGFSDESAFRKAYRRVTGSPARRRP